MRKPLIGSLLVVMWITGCESLHRPDEQRDGYPDQSYGVSHIPDAVPRVEPRTRAGNANPYTVRGKIYQLIDNPEGFEEEGIASWYGTKFHNRRTANGEIYNMYGMTAAHTRLPIPSYVRVTNLANNRSVIVRVNDRGPFHGGRVIDLTYSAAKKLDFVDQGTAKVRVEYINPHTFNASLAQPASTLNPPQIVNSIADSSANAVQPKAPAPENSAGFQLPEFTYLQVGAFSDRRSAETLKNELAEHTRFPIKVFESNSKSQPILYKVQVGPFTDNLVLQWVKRKFADANFPASHVVHRN